MTDLLIVGAGPYGVALAAAARSSGIDFRLLGEPMAFWRERMPRGMLLRSGLDWHLCPAGEHTIESYLQERGLSVADWTPIPVEGFLEYAAWFQERAGVVAEPTLVRRLECRDGFFEAELANGERAAARRVVIAPGFAPFARARPEVLGALPRERCRHTVEVVDFAPLAGRRCLILGGRQSAFEWAALIAEAGAEAVHVVHRHPTPQFTHSDWTWVESMLRATEEIPGWFRCLPAAERKEIADRFWAEGRLKLEPWLAPRLRRDSITIRQNCSIVDAECSAAGDLRLRLDDGAEVVVDEVILATGYQVDAAHLSYLGETLLAGLQLEEGFPALGEAFQSSVLGLYFTSFCSTRAFGPFFGFVAGVRATARIIAGHVAEEIATRH